MFLNRKVPKVWISTRFFEKGSKRIMFLWRSMCFFEKKSIKVLRSTVKRVKMLIWTSIVLNLLKRVAFLYKCTVFLWKKVIKVLRATVKRVKMLVSTCFFEKGSKSQKKVWFGVKFTIFLFVQFWGGKISKAPVPGVK